MKKLFKPFSIFILFTVLITTGQGCLSNGSKTVVAEPVVIDYWRVFDGKDAFKEIIDNYQLAHPNVKINYRKLRFDEYEDELIRAFAEGRGPDIFAIHNTWMGEYKDLIVPMPSSVNIVEQEVQGTVKKEVVSVAKRKPTMSLRDLKKVYVEQVEKDVIMNYQPDPDIDPVQKIYGLPLSMDSLALFYNRDLLSAAGLANPPSTWSEADFHQAVQALTTYDDQGEIIQSGVALGTADNIERATDILSLLMIQVGTEMTDDRGRITFQNLPKTATDKTLPALNALQFYTDFSDPTKQVYTWNDNFPNSFEAFANGETAMFFGYSYHIPLLRTIAPKLNFGISTVPQVSRARKVNYANYWVETVSKDSAVSDWAWDFLLFASQEDQVTSYLNTAKHPAVHRNLIASQLDDEDLAPFAEQTLTAQSWYKGRDFKATEKAFKDLINAYRSGVEDPEREISLTAGRVSQTIK